VALVPWQLSYNGLIMGVGTDYNLQSLEGFSAFPPIRIADLPKPRTDGAFAGLSLMAERTIIVTLLVAQSALPAFYTDITTASAVLLPVPTGAAILPLQVYMPWFTGSRQVYARPTRIAPKVDKRWSLGYGPVAIEFTAADPRIYDIVTQTASAGLSNPTAGAAFPWSWPLSWGASSGGSVLVTNLGNWAAPVTFTIQGPCTNPKIVNAATGQTLTFSLTLANTDTLVVSSDAHTAILNGTASRLNTLAVGSQWWNAAPGTSTINFLSADGTAVAGTLTAAWANTWAWC
jgi:hypothetical protein